MDIERHKNIKDEQFWFTAAVVGFNGLLLTRAEVPAAFAYVASAFVTLLGFHLIMSRWVLAADRNSNGEPDAATASTFDRLRFTLKMIAVEAKALPYVLSELSGSCFYLLIMLMSSVGVIWKFLNA